MPLRDDNPSKVDLLGFEDIVDAVESTVTRLDLDPITVGINAPWGGGKTTVLQLLQNKLQARGDLLCVYISPWEYDATTDTKTTLIGAVLDALDTEIKTNQTTFDKVKGKLDDLRKRVNVAKAIKLTAKTALTMSFPSIDSLTSLFDEKEGRDPSLQGFKQQYSSLLNDEALSHITQVVVLVDDLDRSLPDTVVDSLEAIKLFLSVDKMAFVIAADDASVERAIGQRLASTGQPTTARQYLEKIVQIPFRIPTLSLERTIEYLALLLLDGMAGIDDVAQRIRETRGKGQSLAARVAGHIPPERNGDVELAETLGPILHRNTLGNPRRLKRFLNALWLRTSFAGVRGVELSPNACAKLMIAELLFPDLFAQLLGWLAASNLQDQIRGIESRTGEHSDQVFEWGQLDPPLAELNLEAYLLLAASLRGETVEEAVLPPELRDIAVGLTSDSSIIRNGAQKQSANLEAGPKTTLARYLATQVRLQQTPERQQAIGESLSILSATTAAASTAADELVLMDPARVLPPLPLSLLSQNQAPPLVELVRRWSTDTNVPEVSRRAATEALLGVTT